jgi:hypothetical protein
MARSAILLSSSIRPSSRKSVNPLQRLSAHFHRVARRGARHHPRRGLGEPAMELVDQRTGPLLAVREPDVGGLAPDFLLDGIDRGDALQGILRDRGISCSRSAGSR